jgi:hypothetical protein
MTAPRAGGREANPRFAPRSISSSSTLVAVDSVSVRRSSVTHVPGCTRRLTR